MKRFQHQFNSAGVFGGVLGGANFGKRIDQSFVPIDIAIGEIGVKVFNGDPKLTSRREPFSFSFRVLRENELARQER